MRSPGTPGALTAGDVDAGAVSGPPSVDGRLGRPPGRSVWDDGRPTPQELAVVDWLLTTTRSNRRTLDLERPVEAEVIEECLRIALQAPTAHNDQRWHFVVVTWS